jgi:prevent-host-death family protein
MRHFVHYGQERRSDTMTTLSIAEARNNLAEAINRVSYGGERVLFARRGKPVAALVSAEDLALLERMEDAEDIRAARKALREYERDASSAITLDDYVRTRGARK